MGHDKDYWEKQYHLSQAKLSSHKATIKLLQDEAELLHELWVTVNIADPPDVCNDPDVLRKYLKGCVEVADKYGEFMDERSAI